MRVKVYLVEDHELLRQALGLLLELEEGLELAGQAGTVAEALAGIRATRPDVAVIDVVLPDGNGIELCRQIKEEVPHTHCLILTGSGGDSLMQAVVAGASGYLTKWVQFDDLVASIRKVAVGASLLDASVADRLVDLSADETHGDEEELTEGERRLLALIAEGLTNREIADRLSLAEQTVKNYVSALLRKLRLERRTQAAVYGARLVDQAARRHSGQVV